jgi:site-specific recombinase XerD
MDKSISKLIDEFSHSKGHSLNTVRIYRDILKNYFKDTGISDLKKVEGDALREYVQYRPGQSAASKRLMSSCFYGFFQFVKSQAGLEGNPATVLKQTNFGKRVKTDRFLNEEQIKLILKNLRFGKESHCKMSLFILISLFTGMDREQIIGLKFTDMDLKEKTIKLKIKNSHYDVKAHNLVFEMFDKYKKILNEDGKVHPETEYIFFYPKNPVRPEPIFKVNYWMKIGIKKWFGFPVNSRILKQTYIAYLAKNGVGIHELKALTRIKSLLSLADYIKPKNNANQEYDRVFGKF